MRAFDFRQEPRPPVIIPLQRASATAQTSSPRELILVAYGVGILLGLLSIAVALSRARLRTRGRLFPLHEERSR